MANVFDMTSKTWKEAAGRLGVTVVAPYKFEHNGRMYDCAVYLPDFGSPRGLVVNVFDPDDPVLDRRWWDAVKAEYLAGSELAVGFWTLGDEFLKEELRDHGYFGPEERRPEWL